MSLTQSHFPGRASRTPTSGVASPERSEAGSKGSDWASASLTAAGMADGAPSGDNGAAPSRAVDALELHERICASGPAFAAASLKVLRNALRLYGPDAVVVAFNGGKGATVALHLLRAAKVREAAVTF